jgi:hypothetical protein
MKQKQHVSFSKAGDAENIRAYFLEQLRLLISTGGLEINNLPLLEKAIRQAGYKKWNVYAKKPFGDNTITFKYKDYYPA